MKPEESSSNKIPDVLLPGRHGIPRDVVRASQRKRLIEAITFLALEKGYGAVTVSEIVARARTAKTTFYEHFENKLECFLAAYDESVARITLAMADAATLERTPRDRYRAMIQAMVDAVAKDPAGALLMNSEIFAAGPEGLARHEALYELFIAAVINWRKESRLKWPSLREASRMNALAITAIVREGINLALRDGGIARANEVVDELADLCAIVAGA